MRDHLNPLPCMCQARRGGSADSIKPEGACLGKPLTFHENASNQVCGKTKAALVLVKEDDKCVSGAYEKSFLLR